MQKPLTDKFTSEVLKKRQTSDIILHSLDASSNGVTSVMILSPDTDVLVLDIRRYPNLCQDTCFVTGIAQKHSYTTSTIVRFSCTSLVDLLEWGNDLL